MNKAPISPTQPLPTIAVVLARLLDRLEHGGKAVDAHQYRVVAARLRAALADGGVDWTALLEQSPAAAALYENLHYERAGLCRSRLEAAADAELAARQAIERARHERAAG